MIKSSKVRPDTVSIKSLGDGLYAVENAAARAFQPDEKLSAIVGSQPLPRSELTRKLWSYIKKNGLQDKHKRMQINADDTLRAVFNGKSQVGMFEMTKLVSGHIR
ncbi:MAG TPA: SWIB/MDM2 domain-containing protein [Chthoniobacterales bacterium]|nr:SWIB/MDM2 domain-containing protein [Chthoniobacterales bacterium]